MPVINWRLPVFDERVPVFDWRVPVFDCTLSVFDSRAPVFYSRVRVCDSRALVFNWRANVFDSRVLVFEWRAPVFINATFNQLVDDLDIRRVAVDQLRLVEIKRGKIAVTRAAWVGLAGAARGPQPVTAAPRSAQGRPTPLEAPKWAMARCSRIDSAPR